MSSATTAKHLDSYAGWALLWLAVLVGAATAWNAAGQSLWLDELHTAWVADGPLSEVFQRAALGNQLPLYFVGQWLTTQTLGQSELLLRAPSLIAWLAVFGLGFSAWRNRPQPSSGCLCALLSAWALDRNSLFFATEARPYALMALVNLAAWWKLARLLEASSELPAQPTARHLYWQWIALNTVAFWLQPVAVLWWAAQLVVIGLAACVYRRASLGTLALVGVISMAAASSPAWVKLVGTWQARAAWAAFAADTSLNNLWNQLPLTAIVIPIFLSSSWQLVTRQRTWLAADQPSISGSLSSALVPGQSWFWLAAWALPLISVAVLARLEIVALVHPRYLFASSILLVVWAGCCLQHWTRVWGWTTVLAILVTMIVSQGTYHAWLSGRWASPVRGEDWRGLSEEIVSADTQPLVFCVSSLIEGNVDSKHGQSSSEVQLFEEYLSLPLRSLYRPGEQATVVALRNDPAQWHKHIVPRVQSRSTWWLAIRCSQRGLARRLQIAGLSPESVQDFGGVQLLRFRQ